MSIYQKGNGSIIFFIITIILLILILFSFTGKNNNQISTAPVLQQEKTPVIPITSPPIEDLGPKWKYVSLTPEIFDKIIRKIKSAPNSEMKAIKSGEQSAVTFYYSFVAYDPCEPSLKDFLVFEIETTTYVDENGRKYPNGPITNYYSMRDTDHDNFPEDYWTPGDPNPNAKLCDPFFPITEKTPDVDNLLAIWEAGMNYFAQNLLK